MTASKYYHDECEHGNLYIVTSDRGGHAPSQETEMSISLLAIEAYMRFVESVCVPREKWLCAKARNACRLERYYARSK